MRIDQIPDPVQRERQLDYNRAIAQKIRNRLQQLENANEKDKRRWIWELLQNAKDTVTNRKVDIEIIATNEYIEFKHNGGYFTPRDVSNLINQISSKEGKESIGRFGTGFLTTHTLSKQVEVKSIYTEDDIYYSFEILLDRNGSTEPELVEAIEKSWKSYTPSKIEKPQDNTFTTFKYIKPDIKAAIETLNDFETFIHFNLAFVQGIGKVIIDNQITQNKTIFELLHEPKEIEDGIFVFSFLKGKEQIDLLLAKNKNVSIAIEVNKIETTYSFIPVAENIPHVFCSFPLIGTENFHFPFVINSNKFIPKTERDRLYLKGETKDAETNKTILLHAVDLYETVIRFASKNKWKDFFVVADTKLPKEDDDLDRDWYRENIQKRIRDFLLTVPIVENEGGNLIAILNDDKQATTFFPYNSDTEIREKIWKFSHDLYPSRIPCKKDTDKWHNIIWNKCYNQTIDVLAKEDVQKQERIEELSKMLSRSIENTYGWLNEINLFFEAKKPELFNEYKILPNQYGVFKLRKELYEDKNIPNELKDIYIELGTDWKKDLLHSSIKIKMDSYRTTYALSEAINSIIRKNEFDFSDNDFNNTIYKLISYSTNELSEKHKNIWGFSRTLYYEKIPAKIKILQNADKFEWGNSLNWQINKLVTDISKYKYVEILSNELHGDIEIIDWLANFIAFLKDNYSTLLDNDNFPILPNQNGMFYPKSELFIDAGNIDEELKDVLRMFNNQWFDELLEKKIFLELSENRTRNFEDIAAEIDKAFKNYHDSKQKPEFIKAYRTLFAWFKQEDENKIKIYFDWVYRHKAELALGILGDDEEKDSIFEIIQRGNAHILSKIANNEGISDGDLLAFSENHEDFKQYREWKESGNEGYSKQNLLNEINQRLGQNFNSIDNLIEKYKPKTKRFNVNSRDLDWEAIRIANEEAKDKIKEYLRNQEGYDTSNWIETSNTIIKGVTKNGISIRLVTKGANNGNIILDRAGKEKKVLSDTFSELWIHRNDNVFQITLGEFIEEWDIEYIEAGKFDFH